jgi:hypothetical protein
MNRSPRINRGKQTIKFHPQYDYTTTLEPSPIPATQTVPSWFKESSLFITDNVPTNNFKQYLTPKKTTSHATFKACIPVTDAITLGYSIKLSASLLVVRDKGLPKIKWNTPYPIADTQPVEVITNYPVPAGYSPIIFRWHTSWRIETPNNYSLLITHPNHQHQLPFFTLTGVVDTDKHPVALLLPFFIKDDFEGIIEEGTPIAQILPFPREEWTSTLESYKEESKLNQYLLKKGFLRDYKTKFWNKKVYR